MVTSPMPGMGMPTREEAEQMSRRWWVLLVNGILAVIAGILVLSIPWTLQTFAYFVGAVLIVRGILQAFSPPIAGGSSGWNVTTGIVSAIVGLAIILFPAFAGFTLFTLAVFVGALFIVSGIAAIAGAIANRSTVAHWWLSLIGGILATAVGIFALYRPIQTLAVIVVLVAIWAIVVGAVEIGLSFEVRRLPRAMAEEELKVRKVA